MFYELFLIIALGLAVWAWMQALAVKELAIGAAKQHCRQMGVQFLDGTVVLGGIKPVWNSGNGLTFAQRFAFEFTATGEKRYHGEVQYIGKRRVHMFLEPHQVGDEDRLH